MCENDRENLFKVEREEEYSFRQSVSQPASSSMRAPRREIPLNILSHIVCAYSRSIDALFIKGSIRIVCAVLSNANELSKLVRLRGNQPTGRRKQGVEWGGGVLEEE